MENVNVLARLLISVGACILLLSILAALSFYSIVRGAEASTE